MSYSAEVLSDEERRLRLGCLKQCGICANKLRSEYLGSLPEHRAFLEKGVGAKEDLCAREFEENSKIYFMTPAEVGAIPPLLAVPFAPPLEYMVPGYMNMVNAPTS